MSLKCLHIIPSAFEGFNGNKIEKRLERKKAQKNNEGLLIIGIQKGNI